MNLMVAMVTKVTLKDALWRDAHFCKAVMLTSQVSNNAQSRTLFTRNISTKGVNA